MTDDKRPLKVFLCHASGDKPKVRELYRVLKRRGLQPWLDAEDLLPGQNWQYEIPKALESSDAILICLSKSSVDKEGYVQKEIKFALDRALEMPEGRIFLIPVRLEECEVPRSLSSYQWVDLFNEGGSEKLMKALKLRAEQLQRTNVQTPKPEGTNPGFVPESGPVFEAQPSGTAKEPEKPVSFSPTEQKVPEKSFHKLKPEYVVAVIGAAATLLAALIGVLPQFIKPAPGQTATIPVVISASQVPTATGTLLSSSPTPKPQPSLTPTPVSTSTPGIYNPHPEASDYTDSLGVPMRLVPAGEFTRGNAVEKAFAECQKYRQDCQRNWFSDEAPARKIYLDAFYMDKYEVTNVLYKACVRAGLCLAPLANNSSTRTDYYDNATFDNYPVINIDWNMAKRYCEWRGGARLPTEAEWEKAARSTDERTFPWGEEINQNYANYNNYVGDTSAVGIYDRGKSADGIYDLAGNVWEWVSDRYSPTYYTNAPVKNPGGPDIGTEQVLRGGSWYYSGDILRSTNRSKDLQTVAGNSYGFRCVRPAP